MPNLAPLALAFVEEVGSIYEAYGFKRLNGLIVGLLLSAEAPRSLDDIAGALGRSKGPISEAVRQLAAARLVRRVEGPVARRDYYAADPDVFLHNFRNNLRTVVRNRQTAERFLGAVEAQNGDGGSAAWLARLETMRAFYAQMEAFYARFEAEWLAQPAARPLFPSAPSSALPS